MDIEIYRGEVTCIIGGSGCGKSTFLKCCIGELYPRGGEVTVLGEKIYDLDEEERATALSQIGLMFQYGALLNSLTIADNLAIPLRAHTGLSEDVIQSIVRIKLGLVHLGGTEGKLPSELSGGMRKRAGLARSIALDPEVLICDEPTAGLDPRTAHDMDQLLLDLVRIMKMTVVVVTHERSSIKTIADRIVMLNAGVVHFQGTLDEAMASEDPELHGFFHSGE